MLGEMSGCSFIAPATDPGCDESSVSPGSCDTLWQGTACFHQFRGKGLGGKQSQAGPLLLLGSERGRAGAAVLEWRGESLWHPPGAVSSSNFCLALCSPSSPSVLKD